MAIVLSNKQSRVHSSWNVYSPLSCQQRRIWVWLSTLFFHCCCRFFALYIVVFSKVCSYHKVMCVLHIFYILLKYVHRTHTQTHTVFSKLTHAQRWRYYCFGCTYILLLPRYGSFFTNLAKSMKENIQRKQKVFTHINYSHTIYKRHWHYKEAKHLFAHMHVYGV